MTFGFYEYDRVLSPFKFKKHIGCTSVFLNDDIHETE